MKKLFILVAAVAMCAVFGLLFAGCDELPTGNYTVTLVPEGGGEGVDYNITVGEDGATITTPAGALANTYTVLFDACGGTVAGDSVELAGGKSVLCPAASRDGYVFDGWYTSPEGAGVALNYVTADAATFGSAKTLVLYARYSQKVSVTYILGAGESISKDVSADAALAPIDKVGYSFRGWYKDAAYTQPVSVVSADTLLYGRYLPAYRVSYVLSGGTFRTAPADTICSEDVVELPTPVKDKCDFLYWTDEGGERISVLQNVSADRVVYANWSELFYTLTWDNGGVDFDLALPTTYTRGDNFTLPRPTVSGKIFCGWYDGDVLTDAIVPTDVGDKAFRAKWVNTSVTLVHDQWAQSGADGASRATQWSSNVNKTMYSDTSAYVYEHPAELQPLIAAGKVTATFHCTFEVKARTSGDATLWNRASLLVNGSVIDTVTAKAIGGGYSGGFFTDPTHSRTYVQGGMVTETKTFKYTTSSLSSPIRFGYRYDLETDKFNSRFGSEYSYRLMSIIVTYTVNL